MAETFESYEREYLHLDSTIKRKISHLPRLAGERRKVAISDAQKEIEEAEKYLSLMEKQAKSLEGKPAMHTKVRTYRTELSRLKRELSNPDARTELFGQPEEYSQDYQVASLDQRGRILAGTENLHSQSDRLKRTQQVALESADVGAETLGTLHMQRQQLVRANQNLNTVGDNITRSRQIVTGMARRVATNKFILAFVIVLLVGANAAVVYLRFIK